MVENVAGGLVDLAIRLDLPESTHEAFFEEAASVAARYEALWAVLHAEPTFKAMFRCDTPMPTPRICWNCSAVPTFRSQPEMSVRCSAHAIGEQLRWMR